jgi:hypothetical protein
MKVLQKKQQYITKVMSGDSLGFMFSLFSYNITNMYIHKGYIRY